jgi:hypothetical protein
MGQSLVGGLIGGAAGAFQGFITGGPAKALALGAIGFVGGFASSYMAKQATADALSSAMGPSAAEPKFGGYNVNRRGAALHHQVIYGQTKVGGVVVFDDAHGANGVSNTDNNKYLSRIIAYAGHEIESFEEVYLGGKYRLVFNGLNIDYAQEINEKGEDVVGNTTTKFNNYLQVRKITGGHTTSLDGQSITNFSDDWTSSHRLLGIAHLAILFEYADDVWDEGLPEVTALIKGKKVYDPREAGHDAADPATWEWSDNPALIVRDFLTNSNYGLGEDAANIDDDLVDSSADTCDTIVGGTVDTKKYTCNGAWTTSQPPIDVIAQLMTSCAGYLWYAQGKWRMKAGKYVAPTVALTEDDLRSPISVTTRHSRRDNFNAVRGTFKGPKSNYQFTDYPTVKSTLPLSDSNNFVTVDGGQESTMDLALPFTDNPEEAQRLANIALEKNRSQITITGTFGLNAFDLQVGDNVSITNSRFNWTNKLFEVVAWSFGVENYQLQVNLVLRETTSGTYDEYAHTDFESDNTNLPGALGEVVVGGGINPTTDPVGLTAAGGLRQTKVSWTNPLNNNWHATEVYHDTSSTFASPSAFSSYATAVQPTDFEYIPTSVTATSSYFQHGGVRANRIREDISSLSAGKYYLEIYADQNTATSSPYIFLGFSPNITTSSDLPGTLTGEVGVGWVVSSGSTYLYEGSSSTTSNNVGASSTGSGIVCIAWDENTGKVWFGFAPDEGSVQWLTGSNTPSSTFPASDPVATGININQFYLTLTGGSGYSGQRFYINSGGNPTFNGQLSGNYDSTWFYQPPEFGTQKLATVAGESYVHTGLQPASTHYYWVKAISDASGTALGSSTPIGANGGSTGVGATTLQAVSGDIGTDAVNTTEIADGAVETAKVVDNAVSEQEDDQGTTEQSITTGPISWTTVATCSDVPNPTGADILVQFTATVDADDGDVEYAVRLTRNGSDIWHQYDIPIHWNTADRKMIAGSYRDTGAVTGDNTYTLDFQRESSSSGSLAVENRMLIATELKK